jgi:RNA polymerase sigma-70 factor (ECF subfamily)
VRDWSEYDDKLLVGHAREGHNRAFSELVRRHQVRVYHTVFGMVGNKEDADDLAQLVFIKAFRSLHRFKGQSQFSTWLYRISINCCLDWVKSQKQKSCIKMDDDWLAQGDAV